MTDRSAMREEKVTSATEARQGETTGRVRWVLLFSLVLVIVGLSIAYLVS